MLLSVTALITVQCLGNLFIMVVGWVSVLVLMWSKSHFSERRRNRKCHRVRYFIRSYSVFAAVLFLYFYPSRLRWFCGHPRPCCIYLSSNGFRFAPSDVPYRHHGQGGGHSSRTPRWAPPKSYCSELHIYSRSYFQYSSLYNWTYTPPTYTHITHIPHPHPINPSPPPPTRLSLPCPYVSRMSRVSSAYVNILLFSRAVTPLLPH